MYKFEKEPQPQLGDWLTVCAYDDLEQHRYVRLENLIVWEDLFLTMGEFYSELGRPSKDVKVMIFLLIIKHMEGLSDRGLLNLLRENLPLQYACGLSFKDALTFIKNASLFSKFRTRIGNRGCLLIEESVQTLLKEKKLLRDRTILVDTTVAPSNISHPTDIHLLETARKQLLKIIKKFGKGVSYRTYCRVARKTFIEYIKLGRRNKMRTKKSHGKMIRFVRRNLQQANEVFASAGQSMKKYEEQKVAALLDTIQRLLGQQEELSRRTKRDGSKQGISIKNRIVSVFRDFVRPIPRGKVPVATEFGAKILFELQSGFMTVLKISYDNIPDSHMLAEHFDRYTGMTLCADRGFHKSANNVLAEKAGVKNYYVEKQGRKSLDKTPSLKRARCKRAGIEASISNLKNNHGLGRVRYGRGMEGEEQWIRLGVIGANLKRALKLCA